MFPRLSETFIRNEILELERQGLSLRIFSLKRPVETNPCDVDGVRAAIVYLPERVFREPFRVFRSQFAIFVRYPRGYLSTLAHVLRGREIRSLSRALRRFSQTCCLLHESDCVQHLHAHFANEPTRLASWARMICGISYSVTTHAKDLYQENRIGSAGLRSKLSYARFIVANSEFSAEGLRALFGERPARILKIHNGIDLLQFSRRREEPAEPLILAVGRLVEKKGFHHLLKACRILKDWRVPFRCEIIGSGELKEALLGSIQELDLCKIVKLHGQMAHSEVCKRYRDATVFALPCIVTASGDRDILPNVLKEAMAIGVPVVTTHLDGIEELVTDEKSGLIVPPGDAEALARALQRLLNDAFLRQELGANARYVIEQRFDSKSNFTALRDLLFEATDRDEVNSVETAIKQPHIPQASDVYNSSQEADLVCGETLGRKK